MSRCSFIALAGLFFAAFVMPGHALAREISYTGSEEKIYVNPGEPTQLIFPSKVAGGYTRKSSKISLKKESNFVVIFAQPGLSPSGEVVILYLEDERSYSIRILPAGLEQPRDDSVRVVDERDPETQVDAPKSATGDLTREFPYAPTDSISGLAREMVLISEFGKKKPIPGFKRSNKFSGETILDNGTIEAKVDEIFMGSEFYGYVLTVSNLLGTTQQINPSAFRIDGTRAVIMQRKQLAPKPETAEQKVANAHQAKVYIITRSKKR